MYIFDNYPKKKSSRFYDLNRQKIKKFFKNDKNILSIYEYGQTKAPGISDLDIIIVFKNNNKKKDLNKNKYDFRGIDNQLFDLIKYGNVIKMDYATFKHIQYFDSFNLNLLLGETLEFIRPNKNELEILSQISINDWIPERLLRLQNIIKQKNINISNTLCVINSLCYSLKLIKKFIKNDYKINSIIKKTNILRSNWYNIKNAEEKLVKLIYSSISISQKSYYDFGRSFKSFNKIGFVKNKFKNEIKYEIIKNNFIIFTDDKYKILNIDINSKYNILYIPYIFYFHLLELSNQKNFISNKINKKITPKTDIKIILNNDYKELLEKKINLADNNRRFLKSINIKKGLIRYGYHV